MGRPKRAKQNLIVRIGKSEAEVTNNKRLRARSIVLLKITTDMTRSIARPLRDSTAACLYVIYQHIRRAPRDVLHCLPVPQRIQFNIAISAFDCVREHCPAHFNNVCIPVAGISFFLVGQIFVRHNATTRLSLRQEHSSADGVSTLQPEPSGTRFHRIHYPPIIIRYSRGQFIELG